MKDMQERMLQLIEAQATLNGCEAVCRSRSGGGRFVFLMRGVECMKVFYLHLGPHDMNIQAIPEHIKDKWDNPTVGAGFTIDYADRSDLDDMLHTLGDWMK